MKLVIKQKNHVEQLFSCPLKTLFSIVKREYLILIKHYQSSFTKYDHKK